MNHASAHQLSINSDFIYHPEDGMEISLDGIEAVSQYESNGKLIKPELFFNGSIVRYNGRLFYACRADQRPWWDKIRVVGCELDSNYDPINETVRFLGLSADKDWHHVEDPRLFVHNGRLMIAYTDGSKMYSSELDESMNVIKNNGVISDFHVRTANSVKREKNWSPFSIGRDLYFTYSAAPHVVIAPDGDVIMSNYGVQWDYGQVRGGTPAIRYGDNEFITFFHSSLVIDDHQTQFGQRVYYMGAYTFSANAQFKPLKMTATPLMKGVLSRSNKPRPTSALVVFPVGVVEESDHFVVSYGYNDITTRVIRISKPLLTKVL